MSHLEYSDLREGAIMPGLNIDQKTIKELFLTESSGFLIPDYQRPYIWGEAECQKLWEDVLDFAFPEGNTKNFKNDNEYFLGPIVTFRNKYAGGRLEVIDGQQRLTTLILLLRVLYAKFKVLRDDEAIAIKQDLERCIWKADNFGKLNMQSLKIDSEVAMDNDNDEFLEILCSGKSAVGSQSQYAKNFCFFQNCVEKFHEEFPTYLSELATRIMGNCILLPIESESQDMALRIFSTLNDRGKPLSDTDIFKTQFYKFYTAKGKKNEFISRWRELEEICGKIFTSASGTPMDELFTRYMYFARAKMGIKSSSTMALRKFYENNAYELLKHESTFNNLIELAHFWNDVLNQDRERFSERVLRRLFVLNYTPNSMWTYLVSIYFMCNRDCNSMLDDDKFFMFLSKITGFILAYAIVNPSVSSLKAPVFIEMVRISQHKQVTFADYLLNSSEVERKFAEFNFTNNRPVTKSILAWWAFQNDGQELLSLETFFDIEHIYARNRQNQASENALKNVKNLESLGNKSLLEKRINIRASDYRFRDKTDYYLGRRKNGKKAGTGIAELIRLAESNTDFTESDIENRFKLILESFVGFLKENNLTFDGIAMPL